MDCIGKRISAALFACLWVVVSVVAPVSAHAATYNAASTLTGRTWYVPMQGTGVAGSGVAAAAATALGRANPWVGAITLGMPIAQFLLERANGQNLGFTARNAPFPTPPGWTTDAVGPLPPLVVEATWCVTLSTGAQACASNVVSACLLSDPQHTGWLTPPYWTGTICATNRTSDGSQYSTWMPTKSCPTGYSSTTNGCALSNRDSVKWPSDGIPTYVPKSDGTGIEQHPRDPDPLPATPTPAEIQNPTNNYSPDQFGNPQSISMSPQSGGGYRVDQRVQTTNNNQTTTTINNITINNAGNVVNVTSTTVPGGLETASPTAVPVGSQTPTTINFPTDYNREATQQQAVQKLEDLKQGTGAADAPDYQVDQKKTDMNQELKTKIDEIPGQYTGDKGNWFSWVWTPPVGACSPWVSTIHGQTVTWNVCPYIEKIRDVIGYMLAVGSALMVYSQLFRRED